MPIKTIDFDLQIDPSSSITIGSLEAANLQKREKPTIIQTEKSIIAVIVRRVVVVVVVAVDTTSVTETATGEIEVTREIGIVGIQETSIEEHSSQDTQTGCFSHTHEI